MTLLWHKNDKYISVIIVSWFADGYRDGLNSLKSNRALIFETRWLEKQNSLAQLGSVVLRTANTIVFYSTQTQAKTVADKTWSSWHTSLWKNATSVYCCIGCIQVLVNGGCIFFKKNLFNQYWFLWLSSTCLVNGLLTASIHSSYCVDTKFCSCSDVLCGAWHFLLKKCHALIGCIGWQPIRPIICMKILLHEHNWLRTS